MLETCLLPELCLFFLYAEIHYKFKGIYSRYFKNEPEIIADAPGRLNPGQKLPIIISVKDAHRYPVTIDGITIHLTHNENHHSAFFPIQESIQAPFWSRTITIEPKADMAGSVLVDVEIQCVTLKGKQRYRNDNYRLSGHAPLTVFLAQQKLPAEPDWHFGDLHLHSNYTNDQVEFGASLPDTITAAKAIGLEFIAVTDHSYDLDDHLDNYLKNHPDLPKWKALQKEVASLNRVNSNFAVIPGEEVSCGNGHRRNIHFLILNSPDFYEGSGDSAERWFQTRPQLSARNILDRLPPQALAFAAHPEVMPPLIQRLLIHRGRWLDGDYRHPRLNGMQILNGLWDRWFENGRQKWIERLLQGQRMIIIAGNDAHGNFNRFRQIGFPFFSLVEHEDQVLGKCRTGLLISELITLESVLDALGRGRAIVTDGPFAAMRLGNGSQLATVGDQIAGPVKHLEITAVSTAEFGALAEIKVLCGDLKNNREYVFFHHRPVSLNFEFRTRLNQLPEISSGYLRLEASSRAGQRIHHCLTNPIWITDMGS